MQDKTTRKFIYGDFQVIPLPYCFDNLCYLIMDVKTKEFVLVDPGDFDFINSTIKLFGLGIPSAILTTHKHWDHAGHNDRWKQEYPNVPI